MKKILYIMTGFALVGCASSGVLQIGEDHYMISDSNSLYSNGGNVLQDILKEADEYCSGQGKKVEVIHYKIENSTNFSNAAAQIDFTCK